MAEYKPLQQPMLKIYMMKQNIYKLWIKSRLQCKRVLAVYCAEVVKYCITIVWYCREIVLKTKEVEQQYMEPPSLVEQSKVEHVHRHPSISPTVKTILTIKYTYPAVNFSRSSNIFKLHLL